MALNLPPDPYKLLGVLKDATLPEIRSAHRKLVLKCHPDKVQDPAQKAIKQDEFQKVQQAYEILSDDSKRIQYDESVKLFQLRMEMGRGKPTPRSNPFEFEIKTAEPRPSTYSRPIPQPEVFANYPAPRSHEEAYDIPVRGAKKSTTYEPERRRPSTRDGERERSSRKYEEDDKARERFEKEIKKATHVEKKKSRDREKRKGTEEKHSKYQPHIEEYSDDDRAMPSSREKKASRHREEEVRMRPEEAPRAPYKSPHISPTSPLPPKWEQANDYATEYIMTARGKAGKAGKEEFRAPPLRRTETDLKYNVRHAVHPPRHLSPHSDDDDTPRRSSARTVRRPSEDLRSTKELRKEHKRSPSTRTRDPYIVEPPSPPLPSMKTPKLQSQSSAPPILPIPHLREKLSRSKTQDYPREHNAPPLPRAHTFQSGDRDHGRGREKSGSRLKATVNYDSGSDSDVPAPYSSPRLSHSPRRREPEQTKTRYTVDNGRTLPVSRHREDLRNIDNDDAYRRERSESPGGGRHPRHAERPPMPRMASGTTRQPPQRAATGPYPAEGMPEFRTVDPNRRPKMPPRTDAQAQYFGEIKYSQQLRPENIVYTGHVTAESYRRGSDPSHHTHREFNTGYPTSGTGRREGVYA